MAEFARARSPGIYKQDYIEELYRRYGDMDSAPPAPALPDWCTEPEDQYDDGVAPPIGGLLFGKRPIESEDDRQPHKRRKEFEKKVSIRA